MLLIALIINFFVLNTQRPSLPRVVTIAWNASERAEDYIVQLDGKTVGITTGLQYPVKVTSLGVHYFTVAARAGGQTSKVTTLVMRVTKDAIPVQP